MNRQGHAWQYFLGDEASARVPKLMSDSTFHAVATAIASEMEVLCCHRCAISGAEFQRPVYTVRVTRDMFDQFFNSSYGYRGAYFTSPGAGIDANRLLLSLVSPRLLEHESSAACEIPIELMRESLASSSAKAWLAEHGKEIGPRCKGCEGEWSSGPASESARAEIANGRWEHAGGQKAEWGRKAPFLTKLRFMGAFLDSRLNEFIPWDKRFRALDIHRLGWS